MATVTEVHNILRHPFDREWSIQGLGMLRTYLDTDQVERLHIWDPSLGVEDSTIHDHPWDFKSTVVSGRMGNQRYQLHTDHPYAEQMKTARLRCGVGGGLIEEPRDVRVLSLSPEIYWPGMTYSMQADEFHESFPGPGTVTFIHRVFGADRDLANVCWRTGDWTSAEPRPATQEEITHFVNLALQKWDH